MTGQDLISSSLRLIGVVAAGETATDAEAQDALIVLNMMLEAWGAERLSVFTLTIRNFSLTPGTQTYTFGTGGTFNAARPPRIEYANIVSLNNPSQPLELPLEMLTDSGWSQIPVKNVSSALPLKMYDDGGFPLRNISFWPIPNVAVQVNFYCWTALSSFSDLFTDTLFPPGYLEALRYNLAVRLAPEWQRPVDPTVAAMAIQSKQRIKSINAPLLELECDKFLVSPDKRIFNWLTGQ